MSSPVEDTSVRAAHREAALALGMWVAAMVYTLTYCYFNAYDRSIDSLTFVLWFPDWVFWGIVVPWLACIVLSTIFAFRIMGGESLGEEADASEPPVVGPDGEVHHG